MKYQQLVAGLYAKLSQEIDMLLDGLTVGDLNRKPAEDTNPIGWLLWHPTRGMDRAISDTTGQEQVWVKDGWYKKFGREPNPGDTGFGHTKEQVAAFKSPDGETLKGYFQAVLARVNDYLENELDETELEREVVRPTLNNMKLPVHALIIGSLNDAFQHVGQAGYVRGLVKAPRWRR